MSDVLDSRDASELQTQDPPQPQQHTIFSSASDVAEDEKARKIASTACDHLRQKNYSDAIISFEEALRLRLSDDSLRLQLLLSAGVCCHGLGNHQMSLEHNTAAFDLSQLACNHTAGLRASNSMSQALLALGNLQDALRAFEQSLLLAEKTNNESDKMIAHSRLSSTHNALGDFTSAAKHRELHLQIAAQLQHAETESSANRSLLNVDSPVTSPSLAADSRLVTPEMNEPSNVESEVRRGMVTKHNQLSRLFKVRRYLVLDNLTMAYFKNSRAKTAKRSIPLNEIIRVNKWDPHSVDFERNLRVDTRNRTLWFTCDSVDECNAWLSVLNRRLAANNLKDQPLQTSSVETLGAFQTVILPGVNDNRTTANPVFSEMEGDDDQALMAEVADVLVAFDALTSSQGEMAKTFPTSNNDQSVDIQSEAVTVPSTELNEGTFGFDDEPAIQDATAFISEDVIVPQLDEIESLIKTTSITNDADSMCHEDNKDARQQSQSIDRVPLGCSIQFMRRIVNEAKSIVDINVATTTDVCNSYIIPQTQPTLCALIDLYRGKSDEEEKAYFAPANVFVSHAWKYKITEVLDVMEQYEKDHIGTYFWFDLFVNNQNIAAELPVEWWSTTFKDSIKHIGTVLLVLSPWNDPIPLTRAWCLWEIMCALDQTDVTLEVMLPTDQIYEMLAGVVSDPKSLLQALAQIQSEKAQAFKQTDRDMIFKAIQDTIGFSKVNMKVKDQLRDWYLRALKSITAHLTGSGKNDAFALDRIATVFAAFGMNDFALELQQRSAQLSGVASGAPSYTSDMLNSMGVSYDGKGEFDKAIEYYLQVMEIEKASNSPSAITFTNIATSYDGKGEFEKSVEYHLKALEIQLAKVGENNLDTALMFCNLGLAYTHTGNYIKAIEYHSKSLEIRLALLGPTHSDTATSYNNLGLINASMGDYHMAVEYFQLTLNVYLDTLGPNHPDTATIYDNLGSMLASLGNEDEALQCQEKALAIYLATVGENHPSTAIGMLNIGSSYFSKRDFAKAIEYQNRSHTILAEILGPTHPTTSLALANLGLANHSNSDFEAAIEYYLKFLAIDNPEFRHSETSDKVASALMLLNTIVESMGTKVGKEHPRVKRFTKALDHIRTLKLKTEAIL